MSGGKFFKIFSSRVNDGVRLSCAYVFVGVSCESFLWECRLSLSFASVPCESVCCVLAHVCAYRVRIVCVSCAYRVRILCMPCA